MITGIEVFGRSKPDQSRRVYSKLVGTRQGYREMEKTEAYTVPGLSILRPRAFDRVDVLRRGEVSETICMLSRRHVFDGDVTRCGRVDIACRLGDYHYI